VYFLTTEKECIMTLQEAIQGFYEEQEYKGNRPATLFLALKRARLMGLLVLLLAPSRNYVMR
jgi:hypothetical protein